jgi:alanine dehydrogenase
MALILDEAAVSRCLDRAELIPLMRRTLAEFSSGGALQPVRARLPITAHDSALYVMPGYVGSSEALAVKLVSVAHGNAARGLPAHLATVLLFDPVTGALLALLDGRLITEERTAAVSAAAAEVLARANAKTLALIGSGIQARSHLEAMCRVRRIESVRVWSPSRERREAFARSHGTAEMRVVATSDARSAVNDADLVVTATASPEPVVFGEWLAEGTCVLAIGASRGDVRELDGEVLRRSSVYVDSRAAAASEAGEVLLAEREGAIPPDHVCGEIGEVFAGRIPGRTNDAEITLFKSLGQAVEDAATARMVYLRAKAAGEGVTIEL